MTPFLLTACASLGPSPMPTGYTHLTKKYKAVPGPEPVIEHYADIMGAQNALPAPEDMMITNASGIIVVDEMVDDSAWNYAANGLIEKMLRSYDLMGRSIYLAPPLMDDDAGTIMGNALAQSLMDNNVMLAGAPMETPLHLYHSTFVPDLIEGATIMVTISLQEGAQTVAEHTGTYILRGNGLIAADDGGMSMMSTPRAVPASSLIDTSIHTTNGMPTGEMPMPVIAPITQGAPVTIQTMPLQQGYISAPLYEDAPQDIGRNMGGASDAPIMIAPRRF